MRLEIFSSKHSLRAAVRKVCLFFKPTSDLSAAESVKKINR